MFEKVNPAHPDKIADRIAGAIVDLAYEAEENPKIAVEALIGHGTCTIIIESSVELDELKITKAAERIAGEDNIVFIDQFKQDEILARNQSKGVRCGDNGIFCGMPTTLEQITLTKFVKSWYSECPYDGKFILAGDQWIICQSNINSEKICLPGALVNPLGDWTGGTHVDSGATNRKLGSDMGDAVTGGGLHGKDLSKADVSVNIYAHIKAQKIGAPVRLYCAIGDDTVDGRPYGEIVEIAREYIKNVGGFEKFAEWGLIR